MYGRDIKEEYIAVIIKFSLYKHVNIVGCGSVYGRDTKEEYIAVIIKFSLY